MSMLSSIILTITGFIKTGIGLAAPVLAPLGRRPFLIMGFGFALIVVAIMINNAGRKAVVEDVHRQAKDLHAKDGAENLDLVRKQAEIVKPVEKAETHLNKMKRGSYDKTDQYYQDWAVQPLPDVVLKRLRQR